MKKILGVYNAPGQHWVGDGFPVRSLFSYNTRPAYEPVPAAGLCRPGVVHADHEPTRLR